MVSAEYPLHLLERIPAQQRRSRREQLAAEIEEHPRIAKSTGHQATLVAAKAELDLLSLEDGLLALDVPVLTIDSVQRYQQDFVARGTAERAALQADVAECEKLLIEGDKRSKKPEEIVDEFVPALALSLTGIFLGVLSLSLFYYLGPWAVGAGIGLLATSFLPIFGLGGLNNMVHQQFIRVFSLKEMKRDLIREAAKNIPTYSWVTQPLSSFGDRVPLSILRRAAQIRDTFPDAELLVESLLVAGAKPSLDAEVWAMTYDRPLYDPEPFLLIKRNGAKAYAGVWAEPEFEHEVKSA